VRLQFTPSARGQFLAALICIRQDKPAAAAAFRKQAEQSLRRLERFPASRRRLPEFPDLPFREVIVPPCRFFCRVKGKTVWVAGVWHSSQLPAEPGE
jgi:toxin ParE1/3/4